MSTTYVTHFSETSDGYWHQRAGERLSNLPQGNQEPLMAKDNVGRPAGEPKVSMSVECHNFFFSAL